MNLFTTNRMITVAMALVAVAVVTRIPQAKDALLNESKLFGIF